MIIKKMLVVIIAFTIIASGLGIITTVANSDTGMTDDVLETRASGSGVKRVVVMEDFTNWGCWPCASTNPVLEPAVDYVGYSGMAPAYIHWRYPDPEDPIFNRSDMKPNVYGRADDFYGISSVPSLFLDGDKKGTWPDTPA
ncbi:MAG: hypothetical protein KAS23_05495, partial [Anaerohalosphaera sp.]|nr:hypothetical protein [Anaerohalosphaera sp.]